MQYIIQTLVLTNTSGFSFLALLRKPVPKPTTLQYVMSGKKALKNYEDL